MKSNKSKYENLGYTLRGRPGKRRWHKRQSFSGQKRFDAVLGAVNSAASASNRNNREKYLIDKAQELPSDREGRIKRKKAIIRYAAYGIAAAAAIAGAVTARTIGHTAENRRVAQEVADQIVQLVGKRNASLSKLLKITETNLAKVTPAPPLNLQMFGQNVPNAIPQKKHFPGILEIVTEAKKGRIHPSVTTDEAGYIADHFDMARGAEKEIRDGLEELQSILDSKRLSKATRDRFKVLLQSLHDSTVHGPLEEIAHAIDANTVGNLRHASDKWRREAQAYLGKRVTGMGKKIRTNEELYHEYDTMLKSVIDKHLKTNVANIAGHNPTRGAGGNTGRGGLLISAKEIYRAAHNFGQDFIAGFSKRRKMISEAIRGDNIQDGDVLKYGAELGARPLIAPSDRFKAARAGTTDPKRLRLINQLERRDQIKRVGKALKGAFTREGSNQADERTRETFNNALGAGLVAFHVGAGIGHMVSDNINKSIDEDEKIRDEQVRELAMANRINETRKRVQKSMKQPKLTKSTSKSANRDTRRKLNAKLVGARR